jgi:solute carrier family 44 (choline transporter-like protein), member 2/4/5
VDEKVGDGPLEDRSCTDILFCIIFLAFLGGFGIVSLFGYQNGKPDRLLAPLDGNGRFCGIDNEVKDYNYLYLVLNPLESSSISDLF